MATSTDIHLKTLLAELIAMPTVTSEKATCQAALDWIKYQLRDLPLHPHDFTHNGHSSLVLTTQPTKHPKLLLHSHIDVSPAPPALFALIERDGRYYGRGVFDMKLATAAYLKLLLNLGSGLAEYDLGLMVTTDEETTGGADGVARILAAGWGAGLALNPDSINTGPGWAIQQAAKGTIKYRVTSRGEAGHGSRPWLYRSAFTELLGYLHDLASRFPVEPCDDPEHAHATLSIGRLEGGTVANQVAAAAEAHLDLRFMPSQTVVDMDQIIREAAASYEHLEFSTFGFDDPVHIDPNHPEVQRLTRLIADVTGAEPSFTLSHGASETASFAEHGIPVLMFAPPGGGHHSDDEWVDARGVEDLYEVIRRLAEEVAHSVQL